MVMITMVHDNDDHCDHYCDDYNYCDDFEDDEDDSDDYDKSDDIDDGKG